MSPSSQTSDPEDDSRPIYEPQNPIPSWYSRDLAARQKAFEHFQNPVQLPSDVSPPHLTGSKLQNSVKLSAEQTVKDAKEIFHIQRKLIRLLDNHRLCWELSSIWSHTEQGDDKQLPLHPALLNLLIDNGSIQYKLGVIAQLMADTSEHIMTAQMNPAVGGDVQRLYAWLMAYLEAVRWRVEKDEQADMGFDTLIGHCAYLLEGFSTVTFLEPNGDTTPLEPPIIAGMIARCAFGRMPRGIYYFTKDKALSDDTQARLLLYLFTLGVKLEQMLELLPYAQVDSLDALMTYPSKRLGSLSGSEIDEIVGTAFGKEDKGVEITKFLLGLRGTFKAKNELTKPDTPRGSADRRFRSHAIRC